MPKSEVKALQNIPFLLLLTLGMFLGTSLSAQSMIQASAVPDEVRNDFELRFSDAAKVFWFKDGPSYYGARFKVKGKKIQTVYSRQDRQWVQTVEPITYEEMPDSALQYIAGRYPEHKHKNPRKVSTRNYGILFEVVLGKDLHAVELAFDMHGVLVREDEMVMENDSSIDVSDQEEKPKGLKARFKKLGNR